MTFLIKLSTLLFLPNFANLIMQPNYLDTQIEFLKGVGTQRGDLLKKDLNIYTFKDLLQFYPFRYVDKTKFYKVKEVNSELAYVQLRGKIMGVSLQGEKRALRCAAIAPRRAFLPTRAQYLYDGSARQYRNSRTCSSCLPSHSRK